MNTRRTFFGQLVASLAGILGIGTTAKAKPLILKRFFRWEGDHHWQEIEFEAIRPCQWVISLGLHEGRLTEIDVFQAAGHPFPTEPAGNSGVEIDHVADLLKKAESHRAESIVPRPATHLIDDGITEEEAPRAG